MLEVLEVVLTICTPDRLLSWEAHRLRGLLKYFEVIIIVITSSPTFRKSQFHNLTLVSKSFSSYPQFLEHT